MPNKSDERCAAYAGRHTLPNNLYVTVRYLRHKDCQEMLNRGVPKGHADFKRAGWYWTICRNADSVVASWHGPFTASGRAYHDAMDTNQVQVAQ